MINHDGSTLLNKGETIMPFEIYLLAIAVGIIIGSILPSGYPTFFVKPIKTNMVRNDV